MPHRFHPLIVGCLMGLASIACKGGQTPPPVGDMVSRDSVIQLITDVRRIATPEGIDTSLALDIDGTKQWITIRGLNRANPVLLMIHGGPGSPMMPTSWAWQKPWEDFFTVVQWEQRGAGKNFRMTDTTKVRGPWTMDRIVDDGAEVIRYLLRTLHKEKVVVVGFSWGTEVGTHLAARYPELLHAYVGVGQAFTIGDEKYLWDRTMELATLHANDSAIAELKAIAPYPLPDGTAPEKSGRVVRKWASVFNGGWYGWPSMDLFYRMPRLAPEYSPEDVAAAPVGGRYSGANLYEAMMTDDLSKLGPFKVPMLFFQGRYDLYTPFVTARRFYETLEAPVKKFIPFERSAHFVMMEEPGRFLLMLVQEVLPLTHEATYFPIAADAPK